MLTYDSLVEQAKLRGMPLTKIRGILREYLQIIILKEIYRDETGRKLRFTGGTYLRLAHNLKRFSEDLDFNARGITKPEFENLFGKIEVGLKRSGIGSRVRFAHRGNLYVSRITFPEIESAYNVISKYSGKEGIVIKVETNRPKWKIKNETQIIAGFGELFPCGCTDRGALFADKVDALTRKNRGRHVYDVIFMLSNRFPIDGNVLQTLGIKDDPLEVIRRRMEALSGAELKKQAETLRPFLFDEKEAEWLVNARRLIPLLLEKYRQVL